MCCSSTTMYKESEIPALLHPNRGGPALPEASVLSPYPSRLAQKRRTDMSASQGLKAAQSLSSSRTSAIGVPASPPENGAAPGCAGDGRDALTQGGRNEIPPSRWLAPAVRVACPRVPHAVRAPHRPRLGWINYWSTTSQAQARDRGRKPARGPLVGLPPPHPVKAPRGNSK
jgi:hypothetical protein